MIDKLIIDNFQGHKKTEIEFVPGLNIIVGDNEAGKSAALRAIKWVIEDEPRGNEIIKDFWAADEDIETKVKIIFTNGNTVSRERNIKGDKNDWIINNDRYYKPGKVPEQFRQIIPSTKFIAGDSSVNVCFAPNKEEFLIDTGPTERGKYFDQLSGVLPVNNSITTVLNEVKEFERDIEKDEKVLSALKDSIIESKIWVEKQKAIIKASDRLKKCENKIEELNQLKIDIQEFNDNKNKLSLINSNKIVIPEDTIKSIRGKIKKLERLNKIKILYYKNINKINEIDEAIAIASSNRMLPQSIKEKIKRLKKLELASEATRINKSIANINNNILTITKIHKATEEELNKFNRCPVCKRPIK